MRSRSASKDNALAIEALCCMPPESCQGNFFSKLIQNKFNNEDYYLQIDSHMQFEKNWDVYLINYLERIRAIKLPSHQLPIITCYPRAFNIIDLKEVVNSYKPMKIIIIKVNKIWNRFVNYSIKNITNCSS